MDNFFSFFLLTVEKEKERDPTSEYCVYIEEEEEEEEGKKKAVDTFQVANLHQKVEERKKEKKKKKERGRSRIAQYKIPETSSSTNDCYVAPTD